MSPAIAGAGGKDIVPPAHQKVLVIALFSLSSVMAFARHEVMLAANNLKRIAKRDVMLDAPVVMAMGIDNGSVWRAAKLAFGIICRNVAQQKLKDNAALMAQ